MACLLFTQYFYSLPADGFFITTAANQKFVCFSGISMWPFNNIKKVHINKEKVILICKFYTSGFGNLNFTITNNHLNNVFPYEPYILQNQQ